MTKLLYMDGFDIIDCKASVVGIEQFEGKEVVILDQTCFYAKGGGQDFDLGTISMDENQFIVEAVFFVDGEVRHIGEYTNGRFSIGNLVTCQVDSERRTINSRIHSAGHVLDLAVRKLGWEWIPGKGAHYPHMAFVEYKGEFDANQKQLLISGLQSKVDELINHGSTNTVQFMTPEEMAATGAFVPDNLPKGKPSRAVFYDDFAVPCGGTHVKDIRDVGKMAITNMKRKDGGIRVSYSVSN